ncbi:peroxidasin-like [Acropora millepora]|uniref:peroxidasin-like n=1 Tax=Acropora millepora TaxID=45264 RepID=UPI0010FC6CA5|nr:peroxidasin-like [Acropora millepora]
MYVLQGSKVLTACWQCIILLCALVTLAEGQASANRYLATPPSLIRVKLGGNVKFVWKFGFGVGQRNLFDEFQWGETDQSQHISNKYITVLNDTLGYKNPQVPRSIRDRLSLVFSNIGTTEMNVAFQIQNVNKGDISRTYGSKVLVWGDDYNYGPISLIGIPIITIRTNAVSAVKGDQVNLHCDADGYPEPYVAWVKGGIVLQNTTTSKTLHITNIATSQAGIYTCTATNIAGSVSHSIDVTVST